MARVRKLSPADFEGLYLLREGVESVTVRLSTERMTDEQVQELVELAQTFEAVWEKERIAAEKDIEIHRHIAECAGCPILVEELDRLRVLECTAGRSIPRDRKRPDGPNIHRALVEAIVDRDADSAEYIMKKHIRRGYQEILDQFDGG
jgi:DNA-binding GntR family transcriptional regulator